jgi:DinB superfamily
MNNVEVVVASLERAPALIVPLVREVPQAILKRRPKPGKWSAHEHACHLAAVHALFFTRLDLMLAEEKPRIRPYLPHVDDDDDVLLKVDLGEAMNRFSTDRQRLVDRLKRLSQEDWKRTADHGEYSQYSVFIMFRHLAMHDLFHAYRIEELLLKKDWE